MEIERLAIPDVLALRPRRHGDARGFFSETYRRDLLAAAGVEADFVQDNHAYSQARGTVRGLHFQTAPFAQAKLVRVTRGAVLDVAVDLRRASPTYGRHVAVELSADAWNQIYIPVGFAHGLCTLTDDVEMIYKVTGYYSAAHDRGVSWSDPDIGVAWPVGEADAILSDKDRAQPRLRDLPAYF